MSLVHKPEHGTAMFVLTRVEITFFLLSTLVTAVRPQDDCHASPCHPPLGDLMVGRSGQLLASSTCGLNGPQKYCIIGYLEDEQKCFSCDSRYPYNHHNNPNSHRIDNVITTFDPNRKNKWWQSENGVHEVSIQLDLETLFQFSHLVLRFKSFRPAAMLVERSKDNGRTWKVFRYFAESCASSFPAVSEGIADSVYHVVCDSRYSGAEPSTDGEVVLKALDPSFQIGDPYAPSIQDLIAITNLRVNFTRLLTLGDTLFGRRRRNPLDKYYYAVYEMVVRGRCFCNGHGSQCAPVDISRGDVFMEPGMVHGRCVCQHNTVGNNCERCQDFYNDSPWRPAGQSDPHACRKCNCNGHSERCHFDMTLYLASGGVSGGVCEDCRHNRVGVHCERCGPFYYQDPRRPQDDPNACIPCDCDQDGTLDSGLCDPSTGRCVCKEHVEGDRCNRCKYGFYGLRRDDPSGCQICGCNHLGSVQNPYPCDQVSGQCFCQPFATGPLCDQCLPGNWGLGNTVHRCSPCDCDIGGAFHSRCSPVDGRCECRRNMVGRRCNDPAPGHFLAPLDFYLYEAENAAPLDDSASSLVNPTDLPKCDQYYRQRGYDFLFINGKFVLTKRAKRDVRRRRRQEQRSIPVEPGSALQIIPRTQTRDRPVTWTGPGFVRVQDGAGLRFAVNNLPISLSYHLVIRYEPESSDDWAASVKVIPAGGPDDGNCPSEPPEAKTLILPGFARVAIVDSTVCLRNQGVYYIDISFQKRTNSDPQPSSHILIDSMGLIPKIASLRDFCSQSDLNEFQRYQCVEVASEVGSQVLPEVCTSLIGSMSARIHGGAIACGCNPQGALSQSCSKFGGRCECRANVIGRCCDSCAPRTFGFGPNGCTACDCDPRGSVSDMCDQMSGRCACRREVSGRRCDRCPPGYFGFPRCRPCQCNGLTELCDPVSGACLGCRDHSTGLQCERCVNGYYGDPTLGERCEPCQCPGSIESGRFFALSCGKDPNSLHAHCDCERGHAGFRCGTCSPGFYGDLSLPGARCRECPCNNNIDPRDQNACDPVTGECLRCLHNTQGPGCRDCQPGYYGNALSQDCKECSCDPRGTDSARCPVGRWCLCDPSSGQCPCKSGVVGILCDECDEGFWNFGSGTGCQPCDCDPANSFNNQCDKTTGQCPCRFEFGGRQCRDCGENYFGNPYVQCISCDCNMEGTGRPACDHETGECICRPGVAGIFCDECAPGHESTFPACQPCHPCWHLWIKNLTDLQRDVKEVQGRAPLPGDLLLLDQSGWLQRLQDMLAELELLANVTPRSIPEADGVERLCEKTRMLKDAIDPHRILIDTSPLLNTDIDSIRYEFKRLLEDLIDKTKSIPEIDLEAAKEALEVIRKRHAEYMKAERKVEDAEATLESSREKRRQAEEKLNRCPGSEWAKLEGKVKSLSVAGLNELVCGAPGDAKCSEAKCGGALCRNATGARVCGGPACRGSLPVSQNASETAEQAGKDITDLLLKLKDSEIKITEAKQKTQNTKDQAEELKKKINDSKEKFEKDKNVTKDLIRHIKDYLTDEMVEPEDIDKVAMAVLAIQLPSSPEDIQAMINRIRDVLTNSTKFQEDLEGLQDQARIAQELLKKAQEALNKTKSIDVNNVKKLLEDTEKIQDKVRKYLDEAKNNTDATEDQLEEIEEKLNDTETNLNPDRIKDLLDQIEALKNKTEMNRLQGLEAKALADGALTNATDAETDLDQLKQLSEKLKEMGEGRDVNDEIKEKLNNILMEAEKMAKDVEEKRKQVEDLEERIKNLIRNKEDKAAEVSGLLELVKAIRQEIAERAVGYANC